MAPQDSLTELEELSRRIDELNQERRDFQQLVDQSPSGILVLRDKRLLYCNASAARLFGYPLPSDVVALRDATRLLTGSSLDALNAYATASSEASSPIGAVPLQGVQSDGRPLSLQGRAAAVTWGGQPAIQVLLGAQATRHQTLASLLDGKRDVLQMVLDTVPYWIFIKDTESRVLFANAALAQAQGMQPEEVVGLTTKDVPVGQQSERVGFLASDRRVLETGARVEMQQPVTLSDGSLRVHNVVKVPLHNSDGDLVGLAGISEDITERSQTRQQLLESRILLDTILENMPSGLSVVDSQLNLVTYNDQFLEMLGFPEEQARSWRTFEEFTRFNAQRGEYGPGDEDELVRERVELARQFLPHHFERTRPDGSVLEIQGNPLPTGGFLTVYTDITDRKAGEAALRNSEQRASAAHARLMDAINSISEGFVLFDADDRLVICNETYRQINPAIADLIEPGVAFETLVRESVQRGEVLDAADDPDAWVAERLEQHRNPGEPMERQVTGGRWFTVLEHRTQDGGAVGVWWDITERKQAEEALLDSELRLRTVISNLPVALFSLDDAGRVQFSAGRALGLLRLEAGDLEGRSILDVVSAHTELADDIHAALRGEEIVSERRIGRTMFEFRYTPVQAPDGRLLSVIALAMDVTERKAIEQELADERQNLERAVVQRTQQLKDSLTRLEVSNLQLQEANLAKSRFLSSMSHELRTPLNGILGFADLLHGRHFGDLNERQLNYVSQIDRSGKHLLSLINDLLDIAKIDAGGMSVDLEPIALAEFFSGIAGMMGSQFSRKGVHLDVAVDPSLGTLRADGRKFRQVLLNLLSNALKFTAQGGRVEMRADRQGDSTVRVVVSDNGMGIEPEDLEHVFSEFHQARRVREEHLGGTGIGLALTRRLVELHGGEIGVDSQVGEGSAFWFTLPMHTPIDMPATPPAAPEPPPIVPMAPKRILVAEDNEVNLALILDMLSIHGHEAIVARNGQEAVDLALAEQPDLILMDVRMPLLSGLDATRKLREHPQFGDLPIIALTASTGSEAEERQLTAGMTAHLAKPIQAAELLAVLEHYLAP